MEQLTATELLTLKSKWLELLKKAIEKHDQLVIKTIKNELEKINSRLK